MDENLGENISRKTEHVSYSRSNNSPPNFFDKFSSFFTKKTIAGLAILVLIIGVGAATIAVQNSTEFRQRAATTITLTGSFDCARTPLNYVVLSWTSGGTDRAYNIYRDGRVYSRSVSTSYSRYQPADGSSHSWQVFGMVSGNSSNIINITQTCGGTPTQTPTPTSTPTRPPPCYFDDSGQQRGYGDIDGDGQVSDVDAGLVLTPGLTAVQKKAGDVNGDGVVDYVGDAILISNYVAGVISTFPICATLTPTPTPTIGGPTLTPTPTRTPTPTPTLPPCYDFNGDGMVTMADVLFVIDAFGSEVGDPRYDARYDLNKDGIINITDVLMARAQLGTACDSPTPTPTPTRTPTPTPTSTCPLKGRGDANCDEIINILDFNIWRDEFLKVVNTTSSNFDDSDENNPITILDFNIWRDGFLDPSLPH